MALPCPHFKKVNMNDHVASIIRTVFSVIAGFLDNQKSIGTLASYACLLQ